MWCIYFNYEEEGWQAEKELAYTFENEDVAKTTLNDLNNKEERKNCFYTIEYIKNHYEKIDYKYLPNRKKFSLLFAELLEKLEVDNYVFIDDINKNLKGNIKYYVDEDDDYVHYFENKVFKIMPYYWGDDDEISNKANFEFKENGFKLQWYKYAMRSPEMNMNIDNETFENYIKKSIESLYS